MHKFWPLTLIFVYRLATKCGILLAIDLTLLLFKSNRCLETLKRANSTKSAKSTTPAPMGASIEGWSLDVHENLGASLVISYLRPGDDAALIIVVAHKAVCLYWHNGWGVGSVNHIRELYQNSYQTLWVAKLGQEHLKVNRWELFGIEFTGAWITEFEWDCGYLLWVLKK